VDYSPMIPLGLLEPRTSLRRVEDSKRSATACARPIGHGAAGSIARIFEDFYMRGGLTPLGFSLVNHNTCMAAILSASPGRGGSGRGCKSMALASAPVWSDLHPDIQRVAAGGYVHRRHGGPPDRKEGHLAKIVQSRQP